MENASLFSILIILSLFFVPTQSLQAGLVPVEKTSAQTKKLKKKTFRKKNKKIKFKLRKQKKIDSSKAQQKSNYMGVLTTLFILLILYLLIALTLLILGIIFTLPALWITGIVLLGIPIITLSIIMILGSISATQHRKKEIELQKNQYK